MDIDYQMIFYMMKSVTNGGWNALSNHALKQ